MDNTIQNYHHTKYSKYEGSRAASGPYKMSPTLFHNVSQRPMRGMQADIFLTNYNASTAKLAI